MTEILHSCHIHKCVIDLSVSKVDRFLVTTFLQQIT